MDGWTNNVVNPRAAKGSHPEQDKVVQLSWRMDQFQRQPCDLERHHGIQTEGREPVGRGKPWLLTGFWNTGTQQPLHSGQGKVG